MRLPKKVKIAGVTYDVSTDKSHNGGQGCTGPQIITVGTKHNNKDRQFNTFVHEIAEIACYERRSAYTAEDNSIRFVMDHKQFEVMTDDIASALYPMVSEKR